MKLAFERKNGRGHVIVSPRNVLWIETKDGTTIIVMRGAHPDGPRRYAVKERAENVMRQIGSVMEAA